MKIPIPRKVEWILKIINDFGYEAFIVGGCVRDFLLGRIPKDWDITTNARPEIIVKIFENKGCKVIPTGIKHGTVTLIQNEDCFEITTYRVDGIYLDNRKPSKVEFTANIQEDLCRRDFSINAMAYNTKDGLIDYFNGYEDLKNRVIRCVGNPENRFQEDALRMMRAIRFTAQLGFKLEKGTQIGICDNAYLLENISKERIREEFNKIILADSPASYIKKMVSLNLMKYIIPEIYQCVGFEQHYRNHHKDLFNHILDVVDNIECDLILRLSALFHEIGKPRAFVVDENGIEYFDRHHLISADMTRVIMKRLRYDNQSIEQVTTLVREHMLELEISELLTLKKFINRLGIENLDRAFKLQIADAKASAKKESMKNIAILRDRIEKILNEKQPISLSELKINGYDLIALGIPKGKEIGDILNKLMEIVLEHPEFNQKEKLLELVKQQEGI
ncbi:MAG: CCA tRNA nucleotidyltransferase, partial [Thermotaleaceae bacterium]